MPEFTVNDIKHAFGRYQPQTSDPPNHFKPASVLIPFYPHPEAGLSLVFMKRPENQGPHGGQISFPGGSKEDDDKDDLHVALRETEEEYGIDRNTIEIWGRMKPQFTTVSKFWVTPFAGLLPYPVEFNPNRAEVERLLSIPFSHLVTTHAFSLGTYNWKGFDIPSYLYRYQDDVIWGLTARILYNLITLLNTGNESEDRWPPT